MKTIMDFIKTSAAGGFFVLLPLLLFYLMVDELLDLVEGLALPLFGLLPESLQIQDDRVFWPSVFILIVASFVLGVAAQSKLLRGWGTQIENATLGKISIYRAVKKLAGGLTGSQKNAFSCALYNDGSSLQIVYVIEDAHKDNPVAQAASDKVTIMTPYAPAGLTGLVLIVSRESLTPIDVSMGDVSGIMANFGDGAQELMRK